MSWTHYTDAIIHQQIEMSGHCTCLVPAHPPSRLTRLSTDTNREIIVSVHRHFECNWTDQDSNLSPNPPLSVNSPWVNWTPLLLLTLKSCNNIIIIITDLPCPRLMSSMFSLVVVMLFLVILSCLTAVVVHIHVIFVPVESIFLRLAHVQIYANLSLDFFQLSLVVPVFSNRTWLLNYSSTVE